MAKYKSTKQVERKKTGISNIFYRVRPHLRFCIDILEKVNTITEPYFCISYSINDTGRDKNCVPRTY